MCRTSITRLREVRFPALLAGILALAGCSGPDAGPRTTQQRGVEAFHSIDLRSTGSLKVQVGPAATLAITGTADDQKAITTRVQNGMLVIEQQGSRRWWPGGSVDISLTMPQLHSVAINGAGNVDISGLAGGELTLVVQGAGNLAASGSVDTLTARVNGAGNMDLAGLIARDATVSVNGAGNVQVHATQGLDATVNGVGSIRYGGKPAGVKTAINGVGSISPE